MADKSLVTDNTARERFELEEGGHLAYAAYRRTPGELTIPYVEAAPELRGKGTAGRLMEGVVEHARAHELKITPICGYAVAWFQRNPNARDVLKG